jgi:hypothetical protein
MTRASLWLAGDHLLHVTSNEIRESHQRFYLRDIRGFLVTGSQSRMIGLTISCIITAILLGFFLLVAILSQSGAAFVVFAVLSALSCIPVAHFYFRGRTHHVHIVTRVQTVALAALKRRAQIDRVLAMLTPLIEAAQADLTPVTAATIAPAATTSTTAMPPPLVAATVTQPDGPPPPNPPEDIRAADSAP